MFGKEKYDQQIVNTIETSQFPAPNVTEFEYRVTDHVFLCPIAPTPLECNICKLSCKVKALLEQVEVPMTTTLNGCLRQLGKIDSGAETNIIPEAMFRQLQPDSTALKLPYVQDICL